MTDNSVSPPRTITHTQRGHCAKRLSILDAAAAVFCRKGFAGASIDEIAMEACVSRQTIYNHYREKEILFTAVVEDVMDRANAMLFSTLSSFPDKPDRLEDELADFAVRLSANCLCNQDGKFLRKLVLSEGEHYPHLFEAWRRQGPAKIATALGMIFARLTRQGLLEIDDFDLAARQFLALVNADLQMATLFGGKPTEEELATAARNAARTFLKAYSSVRSPQETAVREPA
ncbi:TetR/AcrR family transcriptional regulator [Phyllobacterium sp. 0TCS1.6C]|jgi:AcrR family transcriptional regulator|uniref:TetR/AcrR family transcriptional regulator n=1 Tax=unclassified Phyllobacterium TaxID=2638441 RepID=UPI002263C874|nr:MULTISPECIES: TetR/AcrR family transcriptional regulator [unclassified Phyllobacterium]MCX8279569.1 TetR/AcrR family transcriptional regulator [Phyllobacterium sp. 0TCS1.6C]MCX8292240.1 TetR/AcrR family transcriptional regulator [Phyllobacterium sp. 0TCS1.6A]